MKKTIYLDYAASTPVDKEVLTEMLPYFSEHYGNAASLHAPGRVAQEAIDKARGNMAKFFHADPQEIIFTSGATESNNLAIKGVLRSYSAQPEGKQTIPHIITSAFEHSCILKTCKGLEKEGKVAVTFVSPDKAGLIDPKDIIQAIKPNTVLISIMYVNNEIGTVQPIQEIGALIQDHRKESAYPVFHTDATQAVNYFNCHVDEINVDLLSMSSHKIYGPKGVGALFIKTGTKISRIQDGGSQEFNHRAGTLNTPGIVGLGAAIAMLDSQQASDIQSHMTKLRDYFIDRVMTEIPDVQLNGSKENRSPNNVNLSFLNVEGESLLLMLDLEGIACSTGSACSSGSLQPSHVLLSIGKKHEEAHGSLRFTLGKHTTQDELDTVVIKLKEIVGKLRKVSGNLLKEYYQKQ